MVIENAFGCLKGRWRCLLKRNDTATADVPNMITACCVLHNICEVHKDEFSDSWLEGISEVQVPHASTTNSMTSATNNPTAESIRKAIRDYIVP
jgi:hypothetical protein